MNETDYYAMNDEAKNAWVRDTFDLFDDEFPHRGDDGELEYISRPPDHKDANTMMAVVGKMQKAGSSLIMTRRGIDANWTVNCMTNRKNNFGRAHRLHDAVYLAAGRALGEVE